MNPVHNFWDVLYGSSALTYRSGNVAIMLGFSLRGTDTCCHVEENIEYTPTYNLPPHKSLGSLRTSCIEHLNYLQKNIFQIQVQEWVFTYQLVLPNPQTWP